MTTPKYLVTGSMGCIGSWVLYHLVKSRRDAVSFDISDRRHRLDLLLTAEEQKSITFVRGDLTDYEQVSAAIQSQEITHIVHLAALQVPFCKADPVLGSQVNVVGTVNILEAARQAGIPHLAYASSIAVYGGAGDYGDGLVSHTALRRPHTLYGAYKVANEETARVYFQDYGVSSICLRPYTVYGVGRDQGLTSDPTKAIVAALNGEPFEIGFGGEMQFQLASDVAQQFIAAADQQSFGGADAYNLGGVVTSVDTFVEHIRDLVPQADISINQAVRLPFPTGFDDQMLEETVPTMYKTPLADGIRNTVELFRATL